MGSLINEDNDQAGPSGLSIQGSNNERCDNQTKEWLKLFTMMYPIEMPFDCGKYNKSFSNLRDLAIHVKAAIGEREISCSKCRKNYTYSTYVREHLRPRPYSTEKRSNCSECRKSFSYSAYVKKFIQTQTEKPYNCSICGGSFLEKQALAEHMQIHRNKILSLLRSL